MDRTPLSRPIARRRLVIVGAIAALLVAVPGLSDGAAAGAATVRRVPVPGRMVAAFRPPISRFGRGHLGIDFRARPGTAVRAVEPGVVVFAGLVGTVRHVVVRDFEGRRVSYSFLASIRAVRGTRVRLGAVLGTTGGRGPNHAGGVLHLGLRIGDTYVDPMQLFADPDLAGRVHLTTDDPVRAAPTANPAVGPVPAEARAERAGISAGLPKPVRPIALAAPRTGTESEIAGLTSRLARWWKGLLA